MGSSPAHAYYDLWRELGVVPNTKMIHHDVFHSFRDKSGRTLHLYADADRLQEELLSLSPSDAKEIKTLCKAIKQHAWFIRATGKNPFRRIVRTAGMLGAIPLLRRYGTMDLGEYAARLDRPPTGAGTLRAGPFFVALPGFLAPAGGIE
jgi:hypothetical protein